MPETQDIFDKDPGAQMKKSPLEIRVDNGKHFITIKEGMKVENISKEHNQPTTDTEYDLGTTENLTHQTISINEGKTIYTFETKNNQEANGNGVVVKETSRVFEVSQTYSVGGHDIKIIEIRDGETTFGIDDNKITAEFNAEIPVGDQTLIRADKALNSPPHLVIKKKYSL